MEAIAQPQPPPERGQVPHPDLCAENGMICSRVWVYSVRNVCGRVGCRVCRDVHVLHRSVYVIVHCDEPKVGLGAVRSIVPPTSVPPVRKSKLFSEIEASLRRPREKLALALECRLRNLRSLSHAPACRARSAAPSKANGGLKVPDPLPSRMNKDLHHHLLKVPPWHGGGAEELQTMATQIFVRAAWKRITGSGSAVGFAGSG